MQPVIDVVLPVFGLIFAGLLAGYFRILGPESSEALNRFVYYFALPALLFLGMARVPIERVVNLPFIAVYFGGAATVFIGFAVLARVVFAGRPAALALGGLASVFGNSGYMGIPLFLTAFGPEGALPAIIVTVLNSAVVIGVVVVMVELDLSTRGGLGAALIDVAKALATSPLVVAPVAGLAWSGAGMGLATPVATFGDLMGAAAGPCALFAIGLFLASRPVATLVGGAKAAEVGVVIGLKLVVQPLLTWALAAWVGLEPFWTASAVILAGLPTGALAFVVASRYGLYVERASAAILGSSVISVVTVALLFILLTPVRP